MGIACFMGVRNPIGNPIHINNSMETALLATNQTSAYKNTDSKCNQNIVLKTQTEISTVAGVYFGV